MVELADLPAGRQARTLEQLNCYPENNLMHHIYVLKSKKDNNLYIGYTNNLEKRVSQHNSGRVRSTKHRTPFILVHNESFADKNAAIAREKYLKSGCGREFIKSIINSAH